MIDQGRIDKIKEMPVAKAKAAMKEYAAELGVTIKAKTIDNMVSEMSAQVKNTGPRVASVTILPARLEPLRGRTFTLYARPMGINNIDECTFQWSFKKSGAAQFDDIQDETKQRLVVYNVTDENVGEYKCKITEKNGTSTTSAVAGFVGTLTSVPVDFPEMNFYQAHWNDFYGASFSPVGWHAIYKFNQILNDDNHNNSSADVHAEMSMHKATVPLLDLISNTSGLFATDSRDGYLWLLHAGNDKDNKPDPRGPFVNI